jgi:hypothetical protein
MSDQIYCTLADVYSDLEALGFEDEAGALAKIRAASEWIERRLGSFIPITEAKSLDGDGTVHLFLPVPLLSISAITNAGTSLETTDYILYPQDRHWTDGPYTRLTVDPDAANLSVWKSERDAISITGSWGKSSITVATGATVQDDPLAAGGATLTVDDGGKISVGMTLLIESEQVLVTGFSGTGTDSGKNNNGAITAAATTITMEASHGILEGEIIRIGDEKMYVSKVYTNDLIVKRGWDGSKRSAHNDAQNVYRMLTFSIERGANGTTAAAHIQTTAISRYIPPFPVNYLARQVSTLMIKKAESGYAGKTASIEVGEIFYHKEFPMEVYEEIRKAYRC